MDQCTRAAISRRKTRNAYKIEELDMDIELFIGEIKKYPELWNVTDGDYHNKTQKRIAWTKVCKVLFKGFEEKDEKDKNEICVTLVKKWRNIKDNYIKSLRKKKSGRTTDSLRRYIYAHQLSFLQQSGAIIETQSLDGDNNTPEGESVESYRPPHYNNKPKKRKTKIESSPIDSMGAPVHVPALSTPESNSDRSFFESLLPSVSSFTEDEKLEFRCDVLNIIRRIRNRNTKK